VLVNTRHCIFAVVTVKGFACVEYTAKYMVGSGTFFISANFDHDSPSVEVIKQEPVSVGCSSRVRALFLLKSQLSNEYAICRDTVHFPGKNKKMSLISMYY